MAPLSPAPRESAPRAGATSSAVARDALCADVGSDACRSACPTDDARDDLACLIAFRFGADAVAEDLARALYDETGVVAGVEERRTVEGYDGEELAVIPALPVGDSRHHLAWVTASFDAFDGFLSTLTAHAPRPIAFRVRPAAVRFFRTERRSYPSAYAEHGTVAYNLAGPLHATPAGAKNTMFHELFHMNDQAHADWSKATLTDVFREITERCGDDHACFEPFAPDDARVPDGTYYAFDARTRDVREYAAELALRYFREHDAILSRGAPMSPPFKCRAPENGAAWALLAEKFFGGVDLTPPCPRLPEG